LLFINGTHQETGKRIITAHTKVDASNFVDAFDFHAIAEHDVRLSTAVLNSARFPLVSPAGAIINRRDQSSTKYGHRGHILDGGYFENNGSETMREIAEAVARELQKEIANGSIVPVFIELINDVDMSMSDRARPFFSAIGVKPQEYIEAARYSIASRNLVQELTNPLEGLFQTRTARGVLASKRLAELALSMGRKDEGEVHRRRDIAQNYFQIRLCPEMRPTPQLGWLLAKRSRESIDALILGHDREKFDRVYPRRDTAPDRRVTDLYLGCFRETQEQLHDLIQLLSADRSAKVRL
jgi:hypothetical protein